MESKTNYTIVGVIVLILIAGLLSAGLWLSVGFNKKTYLFYTVYLHESAAGLSLDSPVKYNGVPVGFVKRIRLSKNDPRQVEILLNIESGTPITNSTTATLISQGITGVTYMGLSAGSSDLTPLVRMTGEPFPVIPAKPSLFNQLFNEENARNIKNTLSNLDKFTSMIASNNLVVDQSLKNANVILANFSKASKDFPEIAKKFKTGLIKFNAMADNMSSAGNNVSKTMVSGKNAIDKISQQTLPPAIILIQRLNTIAANLEKVSTEMRQNPSVVIRGTTPPKPGPGE